jgi:crossover junction endodeoxyribonuclease RusA
MTPLVLRLPWPPPELSPNARPNRWAKARATAQYRAACYVDARSAAGPRRFWPQPPVTAKVVFVVPDKRKHDLDNCMASIKAAFDALVSVGLLVDDDSEHLRHAAPEMRVQKGKRYVEVTLT